MNFDDFKYDMYSLGFSTKETEELIEMIKKVAIETPSTASNICGRIARLAKSGQTIDQLKARLEL